MMYSSYLLTNSGKSLNIRFLKEPVSFEQVLVFYTGAYRPNFRLVPPDSQLTVSCMGFTVFGTA